MEKNHVLIIIASLAIVIAALFVFSAGSGEQEKTQLTVSAAASLTESFTEIEEQFEATHPDIDLILNFAGSGTLRMQIEAGAPIDVFASASQNHMDILASQGLIVNDTRNDFAENSLVMIIPSSVDEALKGSADQMGLGYLATDHVTKVALGDPAIAPVGKYAKGALEEASLWNEVSSKMIYAETVKQVLVYVENDEVDAGFVYMTDVVASGSEGVDDVVTIPTTTSISYPVAMVTSSQKDEASHPFIDYILSEEGKDIFEKYGFTVTDTNA